MSAVATKIQNFVGGEFCVPGEGRTEEIHNPASGEAIATAPRSDAGDVDRAVGAASAAFHEWSQTPPGERALALLRIADALEARGEELSQIESLNVGKPIAAMRDEIPFVVDNLRFFAGAARCMEGRAAGEYMKGYTSMLRREPVGVVGQIAPWNYPLMMAVWKIGPALAAGNTVVLKASEQTPMTAAMLASICAEHLPAGVLNVVFGHGEEAGAARAPSPGGDGVADGRRGDRQGDRARRLGLTQARAPRGRRQGAGPGVRRRGCPGRDRGRQGRRVLQRRPGLHGGQSRAGRPTGVRRVRQRPGGRSRGSRGRRSGRRGHRDGPARVRRAAGARHGLPAPRRRARSGQQAARPCPARAASLPPRCWPVLRRTTRSCSARCSARS
jgi:hypothetical protein